MALVLLGGCLGVGGGAARPAVTPMLSELPGDASKRDAVLDQANMAAGPEQRPGQTPAARKVETAAATAAAILGGAFSHTSSTTLGTTIPLGESTPGAAAPDATKPYVPPPVEDNAGPSNADLIPWIK